MVTVLDDEADTRQLRRRGRYLISFSNTAARPTRLVYAWASLV